MKIPNKFILCTVFCTLLSVYSCNNIPDTPTPIDPPTDLVPTPDPDPDPVPPPTSLEPKFYIQWDQREAWARKVELAYTEWRGHRDLLSITTNGRQYLKNGSKPILDIGIIELNNLITKMEVVQAKSRTLQHRIKTVKHKKYSDRSQVRKSVANTLIKDQNPPTLNSLSGATAAYSRIASQFPEIKGCDSIRCKLLVMNNQ